MENVSCIQVLMTKQSIQKASAKSDPHWHPRAGQSSCSCSNWHSRKPWCSMHVSHCIQVGYPHLSQKKKNQRKSMSSVNQSSSVPQELHPSLSAGFSFSHSIFQLFMTTQPRSIFPSSRFSPHHPLPHLQCHLCQLWLAFFGFSKKMSPGIVPHSLLDTKAVPKLKHEANIFPGISSSARQWWWQLTAIRRTRLYTLTSWTKEIQYLVVKTPGKPHNCSYYRGIFSFHPITCCRHSCLVSKWQNFLRAIT